MTELLEKIKENESILFLRNIIVPANRLVNPRLVGGAIIDILEDRTPKDFDFVGLIKSNIDALVDAGFVFIEDSASATTYKRNDMTVQVLKTSPIDFDFTISQASYSFREDDLKIDYNSFRNKTLIPVSYSKFGAKNSLLRIPHWKNKGYSIGDKTFRSLVEASSSDSYKSRAVDRWSWGSEIMSS